MSLATLEDELQILGLSLIGQPPKKGKSIKEQNCIFCAHHGTGWAVVFFCGKHCWIWTAQKILQRIKQRWKRKAFFDASIFSRSTPLKLWAHQEWAAIQSHSKSGCGYVCGILLFSTILCKFLVQKKGRLLPFSCFSLLSFCFQIKLENRYKGDIQNDHCKGIKAML